MTRRSPPLLFLPIVALLVLLVVALKRDGPEPAPLAPTTTAVAPPGPAPGAGGALDGTVRQLQGFVERERGLAFKAPVKVTLLDDGAFRARALQTDDEDREEVKKAELVLQAMGLLRPGTDLMKEVERLAGTAVVGLYDTESKELVLRGEEPSPYVRLVLVHELTHALEDQHFNLHREDLGDEATLAFRALEEGSALRVEAAYRRSLPSAERRRLEAEEAARAKRLPERVPSVVQVALGFPYDFGPDLVSAIVDAGGRRRLDAAFANPPRSTEQVLDPDRYLRGDAPRPVPVPKADLPAFDDGEVGELFLVLMLRSELGTGDARRAAKGWGGDRYVAWRQGDRTCIRIDFVMDDAKETAELVEALREWADGRRGSATSAGTSVTTCG